MNTYTGILLAGGRSSRFGSPKAFATFKGQSLYRYPLQALQNAADEVMIISAPNLTKEFKAKESIRILEDIHSVKGLGPMAGIYSCMKAVNSEWYMVLPCDMPLISADILHMMQKKCRGHLDAVVLNAYGKTQPLVAIYNQRIVKSLEGFLKRKNLKMMEFLDQHEVLYVDESIINVDPRIMQNINREEDLNHLGRSASVR